MPGLIVMARRREPVTKFVLVVLLVYPLMYYIVVSCDRYRYPILWASQLPAGYGAAILIERVRRAAQIQRAVRAYHRRSSFPCARVQFLEFSHAASRCW